MAEKSAHGFPLIDLEQDNVRAFLNALHRERLPALLFTGPPGVGKELTAIDFGRRLCCERSKPCVLGGEMCESCEAALKLEHPGIHLVYGTPTQGSGEKEGDDEPDIGKVLDEKRRDVFATYDFKKKPSIRIARARAIIKRAGTKPFRGAYNVFIVVDAHLMREEAQNALLKLVEEPPPHAVIIFISPTPDAILYTIRSRCQRVRFSPLKPSVIEKLLSERYDIPARVSAKAASLAQGSITRALTIAAESSDDERAAAFDVLAELPEASTAWIVARASNIARGASRDRVARFLHELAVAYRDTLAEDPDLFINRDRADALQAQRGVYDRARLPHMIDRIVKTRDDVLRRNLNAEAALVDLLLDMKQAR